MALRFKASVTSSGRSCSRKRLTVRAFKEQSQMSTAVGLAALSPSTPLEKYEYQPGPLGTTDLDIAVTHNGVCHTDIHMAANDWGITTFPMIPGHEVVGTVLRAGPGVTHLAAGDRVGVGWIRDSCRCCPNCLRGEENLCVKGYTGLIVGGHGGFQPVMRAPADFSYKIPEGLGSAEAAPLLCAGITVYAPLRRYVTRPGMRVAVVGIGGLGHLAVQFAAKMGAEVTAIDVWADKADEAARLGATAFQTFEDAIARAGSEAAGAGFDLLLNCASGAVDTARLLALLANDGSLVQLGIPGGGAKITLPLQDLVFGQKRVAGSIVGGRADMQEMLQFAADQGVAPMVELMKLSQVNEALARVASGKARYRVVLETDWP